MVGAQLSMQVLHGSACDNVGVELAFARVLHDRQLTCMRVRVVARVCTATENDSDGFICVGHAIACE